MEASGIHFCGRRVRVVAAERCKRRSDARHAPVGPVGGFCLAESGVALPVSLGVLLVVGALATVAARASIVASNQSFRDLNVKRATQAAYAGVQTLRYRTNLMQPGISQCVARNVTDGALSVVPVQADGWCDTQSEDLGNGASYSARISASASLTSNGQLLTQRKIVSTGTADGVKRRIAVTVNAATGAPLFAPGYAAVSLSSVDFGNTVEIAGGLGSNGNITLRNSAQVCGPVTPGTGKALSLLNSAGVCGGFSTQPAQQDFQLQPVDVGDTATFNHNARLTNAVSGTGSPADVCTSCDSITWDPFTRVLSLRNNATLTLSGDVYNLCGLELHNSSQLLVAARDPSSPLKIYIDSPDTCGAGLGSVRLRNNTGIVNLNSDPTTLQLHVAGSTTTATSVSFENSFDTSMIMAVYAPNSTIGMYNSVGITGAVAGKLVQMQNNTSITYHERIENISTGSTLRVYNSEDYIECTTAAAGAAPDSGC
jgi:hypothetical protein